MPPGNSLPDWSKLVVGRKAERRRLRASMERSFAGDGAFVLISGSAGIGKSTLAIELEREATERGALVVAGGCYDLTTSPAYGLWADAFQSYIGDGGKLAAPNWLDERETSMTIDSRAALHRELLDFVADLAAIQPLVLILEDIHWSDPASLEALRFLARQRRMPRILVVATYRDDEISPRSPLSTLLPLLVRETGAERIELQAFNDEEIRSLVAGRYNLDQPAEMLLANYLKSRTGGNPFFLTEVLRVLEAEHLLVATEDGWRVGDLDRASVPLLVRQAIESWLAKLDDGTRRLLELAAVIGEEVPLDLWGAIADVDDAQIATAVDQALANRLLVHHTGTHSARFSHALVRETLYQRLPLARRQVFHRDVADSLASRPDPPLNAVASHFAQANDPRAIRWLVSAGERALALYAAQEAVEAFERASRLSERFSLELSTSVYRKRAAAFAMLGEFDRARKDLNRVLDRSLADGDRETEWQALVDLAMHWSERDYDRTGRYCHEALELAREAGDRRMIARSLNQIANWHVNRDEADVAVPIHLEALALYTKENDREEVAVTLDYLGLASYLSCDWAASVEYYERAIRLLRDMGDRQRLSSSLATITLCSGNVGADAAVPVFRESSYWAQCGEEGLAIAREIGWPAGEAYALTMQGYALGAKGYLGRALDAAESAYAIADEIEHREWTAQSRFCVGSIRAELFDDERAVADLEQALALARHSGSHFWINMCVSSLASLYVSRGDIEQASAVLQTITIVEPGSRSLGQRRCRFVRAELDLARNDPDSALETIEDLTPYDTPASPAASIPMLEKLRGDALAQQQRWEDAEAAYAVARDGAKLFGLRPILWRINVARGVLYQQSGRISDAANAFHRARETINELAATVEAGRLREQFRTNASEHLAAVRAGERARGSTNQLSARELEVLRHLVEGESDREIGEALSISPRTVMRHVASILRKLDVSSRTAAATFAVRQELV